VVTAVGGMPEVVEDGETGFLVPPGDPEALADRLLILMRDPPAAAALGRAAGRLVAERFALGTMVAEYRAVYREAVARSVAGRWVRSVAT
jgi:glycosyltransferase involved in cell wall biosynthesis